MGEVTVDTQKMKKKSIIFGSIAGASIVLAIASLAISSKIEGGDFLLLVAVVFAISFVTFTALFALRFSDYRKLKKGLSLDAEDPKLKVKVIAFGVSAIVCFVLLIIGLLPIFDVIEIESDFFKIFAIGAGAVGTITFLVLFINFINKFKRLNK